MAIALLVATLLATAGCGGSDDTAKREAEAQKAKAETAKEAEAKRVLFCAGTLDLVDTISDLIQTVDLNQIKIDMIDIGDQIEQTAANVPSALAADVRDMRAAYGELKAVVDQATTYDELVAQGATMKPKLDQLRAPLLRFTEYAVKNCPDLPTTTAPPSAPATLAPVPTSTP